MKNKTSNSLAESREKNWMAGLDRSLRERKLGRAIFCGSGDRHLRLRRGVKAIPAKHLNDLFTDAYSDGWNAGTSVTVKANRDAAAELDTRFIRVPRLDVDADSTDWSAQDIDRRLAGLLAEVTAISSRLYAFVGVVSSDLTFLEEVERKHFISLAQATFEAMTGLVTDAIAARAYRCREAGAS